MECDKLDLYLTDYLEGELDRARTDELLDHVEKCEACRAEFQSYQEQDKHLRVFYKRELERTERMENPIPQAPVALPSEIRRRATTRWLIHAVAAALFVAVGFAGWSVYRRAVPTGGQTLAHVREADGQVLVLKTDALLQPGSEIRQAEKIRVPHSGYLSLVLADGNILEARGGTQLSLLDFPDRLEVAMDRGQVWAHLKNRPEKAFVVRTAQLTATAHGTVYGVEEGLDRSVVAVAEGDVIVSSGGAETDVSAGESYSSRTGLTAAFADAASLAWSRLQENLTSLFSIVSADSDSTVPPLEVQTAPAATPVPSTPIVAAPNDLVAYLPADTLYVLDLRDLKGLLSEFRNSDYSALAKNEALRLWWENSGGQKILEEVRRETEFDKVIRIVSMLDGQVAVGVTSQGDFVLMAECIASEQTVRLELETQLGISVTPSLAGDEMAEILDTVVRAAEASTLHPDGAPGEDLRGRLYVSRGCIVLSNEKDLALETVNRLSQGGDTGFFDGEFWSKIRRDASNPRLALAANLGGQVANVIADLADEEHADQIRETFDLLGLPSLDYLLLSPSFEGRGTQQAARLAFVDDGRYGAMDWIAEPAPMRGLDFFSPTIPLFASAIARNPNRICLDYLAWLEETGSAVKFATVLAQVARMTDFFESFGGEIAIGVDKPILPFPNVKIAVEMSNPAVFQAGIDRIVVELQAELESRQGKLSVVEEKQYHGYTIETLIIDGVPLFQPSWTYVNGFFVWGPGPEFVRNSIDVFESGHTIANSSRFLSLVPTGSEMNVSLLVYQDVAQSVPSFVREKIVPKLDKDATGMVPDLSFLESYSAPGIVYAYARPTCIDVYLKAPTGIDLNLGMAVPMVANWLVPRIGIGQTVTGVARAQVALEEMKEAALKFQAENGRLPQSLSELANPAGQYIDRIPYDPFAGGLDETVRLVPGPTEGSIRIYSIGPDGVDDRGAVEYNITERYDGPGDIVVELPELEPTGTTSE
ncbi:FecR domain-containing protein [Candidatus Sumerlaeota bacterium]|nr:FecR domain-containing protein [Candidatus Sumerlaeota bacterium]